MLCSKPKCLASIQWFGHPDDPALKKVAEKKGWRLFEQAGWRCPTHHKEPTP